MQTKLTGGFWKQYQELVRTQAIPHQWKALNDQLPGAEPSHCLANFKIAAGLENGTYYGTQFQDSDVGKWIEGVAYSLRNHPDAELESLVDGVVDVLGKAQLPDGYLNTFYQLKIGVDKRFTNLRDQHELYCAGHLLEGAVAYFETTGKRAFLDIMLRYIDLIDATFGAEKGKVHGYPGHPELELALVRLYEVTHERRHLDLAAYLINQRGASPNYFDVEAAERTENRAYPHGLVRGPGYYQADRPVREQIVAQGHAVRAVYLYSAMADLARLTNDETLVRACDTLWQDVTERQMYVTGGIGASHLDGEVFTFDYDLPNDTAYSETCASVGLVFWARRMAALHRDSRYADVMERSLHNAALAGMALDGKSFFYVNPLSVTPRECVRADHAHVKPTRQPWLNTACCPPNLARLVSSIQDYAISQDGADVYVDLFMDIESSFEVDGVRSSLRMKSGFPWNGRVRLELDANDATAFLLHVRIPSWCDSVSFSQAGALSRTEDANGYAVFEFTAASDSLAAELAIDFPMQAKRVYASPRVRFDTHRTCLSRGPLVYCVEEQDVGADIEALSLPNDAEVSEHVDADLLPDAVYLVAEGLRAVADDACDLYSYEAPCQKRAELTFIPYFMWCNRTPGEMSVWLHTA